MSWGHPRSVVIPAERRMSGLNENRYPGTHEGPYRYILRTLETGAAMFFRRRVAGISLSRHPSAYARARSWRLAWWREWRRAT
jgi:hypothetical protein